MEPASLHSELPLQFDCLRELNSVQQFLYPLYAAALKGLLKPNEPPPNNYKYHPTCFFLYKSYYPQISPEESPPSPFHQ